MATFQDLLKQTMKSKGHDIAAAAKAIPGVGEGQIKGYIDGRFPNSRNNALDNVAAYIGVKPEDIVAMKPSRGKKAGAKKKASAKKTAGAKRGPGRPPKAASAKKAAGAKRGPGRPPKAASAKKSAGAKRGPGRPPKSAAKSSTTRGPGRPRKTAAAKRGAGRPRQAPAVSSSSAGSMATLNVFGAEVHFTDLNELKDYINGRFGEISLTIMGKKKEFKSLAEVNAFVKEFEKLFK